MDSAKLLYVLVGVLVFSLTYEMYQEKFKILSHPHQLTLQAYSEIPSLIKTKEILKNSMDSEILVGGIYTASKELQATPGLELLLHHVEEFRNGSLDDVGREALYAERRARLERVCHEHRNQTSFGGVAAAPRAQLRWLNRERLVVCFSAKVGTTSWCHYLLKHAFPNASYFNTSNAKVHLIALRQLVSQPQRQEKQFCENPLPVLDILQQLASYTKVVNVRHPFARLVSAYRDKIEPCPTDPPFTQDFSITCFRMSTRELIRTLPPLPRMVDFKDFVQFLIDKIKVPVVADRSSFNSYDVHWRPYFVNCGVCDLSYKYIIKMETWNEDLRYLLPKFNIGDEVHGNALNSANASYRYFKTLPRPLILQLYEIYKIDFEMFDYSLDEYLH
ncbi:carbohydrate sulfotransferase 11 [Hyalella azteca]|uniref:Carbohydrate sulfotransferase n=1 Tax=Hyalella azteca TaxID=294128 RepID=A0A979FSI3_HYAAZ|nr:carbohydrate sulfotransferase 11 [Hyalella azteca]